MLAGERSIGREVQRGAVQRSAVALDYADHEPGRVRSGNLPKTFRLGPGDIDRAFMVAPEPYAAFRRASADARSEIDALRIPADERLGKDDDLRARIAGTRGERRHTIECACGIEGERSGLNDCCPNQPAHFCD